MSGGRNYERKGDPFTLKVMRGEGPPTVRCWARRDTGREYYTRVRASDCQRLEAKAAGAAVREAAARLGADAVTLAGALTLFWDASDGGAARLLPKGSEAAGVAVSLTASRTGPKGGGVRVSFFCPECGRRCGIVYASRWGCRGVRLADPLIGCRECLGLTDESRQRHRCPDWAAAVQGVRPYKARRGFAMYRPRYQGAARERAEYVSAAGAHRVLPQYFPKPSRPDRWGDITKAKLSEREH